MRVFRVIINKTHMAACPKGHPWAGSARFSRFLYECKYFKLDRLAFLISVILFFISKLLFDL